ncbi:uncharacterized protein SOCEGT47_004090 [Sorangium cellulosum]|uniref:Uncharacterized protein n=1 Tax=Sorangium cellulosum TaxID=56 RepID=A0A4V0NCQ1_SORCE|nr:hypothetical protein [Sorangium cellulosum]AUX19952.1 uncharacterized protein SOCEGT47_004090 [Sorangium cellulosum]
MPDAEERLSLATCAFVASCILLAPREWVSAGLGFALSLSLFAWHLVRARGETSRRARGASTARPQAASGVQRSPGEEPAEPA